MESTDPVPGDSIAQVPSEVKTPELRTGNGGNCHAFSDMTLVDVIAEAERLEHSIIARIQVLLSGLHNKNIRWCLFKTHCFVEQVLQGRKLKHGRVVAPPIK